jgi:hypothetical protein
MAGLLAILAPKGKGEPKGKPEPEEEAEESSSSKYGDELAGLLKIAPEDKSAFLEALHKYVMECQGGE